MSNIVFRPHRTKRRVDLNVTPMVDVLFLLLIFFSLTSTFKRAGELELRLPESTTAGRTDTGAAGEPVDLVLTEKGTLLVDGTLTTFENLPSALRAMHDRQPDRKVTIDAEEGVRHGEVIKLLDAVREAGFEGVGIGVRNVDPVPVGRTRKK